MGTSEIFDSSSEGLRRLLRCGFVIEHRCFGTSTEVRRGSLLEVGRRRHRLEVFDARSSLRRSEDCQRRVCGTNVGEGSASSADVTRVKVASRPRSSRSVVVEDEDGGTASEEKNAGYDEGKSPGNALVVVVVHRERVEDGGHDEEGD